MIEYAIRYRPFLERGFFRYLEFDDDFEAAVDMFSDFHNDQYPAIVTREITEWEPVAIARIEATKIHLAHRRQENHQDATDYKAWADRKNSNGGVK
jgi:hypothetical protein